MTADAHPPATGSACQKALGRHRALLAFLILLPLAVIGGAAQPARAVPTTPLQTWSCGAAALVGVAERVDPQHAGTLAQHLRSDPGLLQGARSMLDLANAARDAGLRARGLRIECAQECPAPCIAHLRDGHFVAVIARRPGVVEYLDDGVARRATPDQFAQLFSGAVLLLEQAPAASKPFGERP